MSWFVILNQGRCSLWLCCKGLIKTVTSLKWFSSEKTIEIDITNPFITNMRKCSKSKLYYFPVSWIKTDPCLCGCSKFSLVHICFSCLFYQLKRKYIWTTGGVSDITSFFVFKVRHEFTVNYINSKIALLKLFNTEIEYYKIDHGNLNENVKASRCIISCLMDVIC
jgi:hypothetical protein